MKKTVLASTLAVGLGVTGFAAGNSADAAEQGVDKAELANLAQSNPEQLNAAPVQEGSYSYNFNYNGLNYNFESNGQTWSWSYGEGSSANASTVEQPQQAQTEQPAQQTAPQTEQTQQPQQEATTKASTQSSSSNEVSSGSSVNVNTHLQAIAQGESGGDLTADRPSLGAEDKYPTFKSTWDLVVPSQYKSVSPTEPPESVQDPAAVKLYNE